MCEQQLSNRCPGAEKRRRADGGQTTAVGETIHDVVLPLTVNPQKALA